MENQNNRAFVLASWAALAVGILGYLIGLFNAQMMLNEKGYYLIALMFGLFAAVSVQKSVRDKQEGVAVTQLYLTMSWVSLGAAILLLTIGLFNAELLLSEKGYYAMAYVLSLYSAVAVQKNVRDKA